MPRRIETHFLAGPAGRIEALLEEPDDAEPSSACLVCHPHPLYGGTMHNKVVYRLARGARRAGAAVLRFNFRGVNRSEGEHAHGVGEVDDARVALEFLRGRYPGLPYSVAGFSFGSRVALRLGCGLGDVVRVIAAGFPTTRGEYEYLSSCTVPKVFLQSTRDEHSPMEEMARVFEGIAEPKRIVWIDAADHFFKDKLDEFEEAVVSCWSA